MFESFTCYHRYVKSLDIYYNSIFFISLLNEDILIDVCPLNMYISSQPHSHIEMHKMSLIKNAHIFI